MLTYSLMRGLGDTPAGNADAMRLQSLLACGGYLKCDPPGPTGPCDGGVGVGTILALIKFSLSRSSGIPGKVRDAIEQANEAVKNFTEAHGLGRQDLAAVIKAGNRIIQIMTASGFDPFGPLEKVIANNAGLLATGIDAFLRSQGSNCGVPAAGLLNPMASGGVTASTTQSFGARYPAGSVSRFNVDRKIFSIYSPAPIPPLSAQQITQLPTAAQAASHLRGLGAGELPQPEEPPPAATTGAATTKAAEEPAQVPGVPNVGEEHDKKSIFKKPLFWVAVAGGLAVLGGGAYAATR